MEHQLKKPSHSGEIAQKLQGEIDVILANVDEKSLFAEFRQEEVFDIQHGDTKEIVRHTLDERIFMNRNHTRTRLERIETTTTFAVKKAGAIARLAHYLFKPLHF